MKLIKKPDDQEFPDNEPLLAALVPDDGLLLKHLSLNMEATKRLIGSLPEDRLMFRYAEGKWTIREILMHLIDMERIYTYRALRFARNDQSLLAGFDAGGYVQFSGANDRPVSELLKELEAVRHATIQMINGFSHEAFLRTGTINGSQVSVSVLLYHIAGHELHHINLIKEKYLGN